MSRTLLLCFSALSMAAGCRGEGPDTPPGSQGLPTMQLSSAFQEGQTIPTQYTGNGKDVSPPLKWTGAPAGTKSFALTCDDPDAPRGTWVHWVIYNLPPERTELPEGVLSDKVVLGGARQGTNDFKKIGYGGPKPPPGKPHRYFFHIYALDRMLDLDAGATQRQLLDAMKGHILAEGKLMGTYGHPA